MARLSLLVRFSLLAAVLLSLGGLAGCASTSQQADPARVESISSLAADITSGKTAFGSHCASCHGADGKSGSARRDTPNEVVNNYSSAVSIVLSGEDEMPSFSSLSDQTIADILGYLKTLN